MGRKRYDDVKKPQAYLNPFKPKNDVQGLYMDVIEESIVTFGTGPAGTGKTYIAAYMALQALLHEEVDRVVLTRPIVAVEDIGFLPGDMHDKINPYVRPLFDAIEDHLGPTKSKELLNLGRVEVLPLAYMRGRSLNRSFIVLDEAQNTTKEQMKMFLTRLGYDSKMVVTGDVSQSDLDIPVNGLQWASDRLKGRSGDIGIVEFSARNIVRHPLIETMIQSLDLDPKTTAPRSRHKFSETGGEPARAALTSRAA